MEKMNEFFTARVDSYDEHMLNEVDGCREAYGEMSKLVPENTKNLLDLGCGRTSLRRSTAEKILL